MNQRYSKKISELEKEAIFLLVENQQLKEEKRKLQNEINQMKEKMIGKYKDAKL